MEEKKNPEELTQQEPEASAEQLLLDLTESPSEETFDLDEILREFSAEPAQEDASSQPAQEEAAAVPLDIDAFAASLTAAREEEAPPVVTDDTLRLDIPQGTQMGIDTGDTIRFAAIAADEEQTEEAPPAQPEKEEPEKAEPYSENWQPEFEQPIADYVPAAPIVFRSRSKAQELKRKLVTGPERRYYEMSEHGLGKVQAAIFFSLLIALASAVAMALYTLGVIPPVRLKAMVFVQFLALLLSATLGCYQMMEGLSDLFHGRYSLNTMLTLTFAACLADGVLCLQQERIPCCAAFSLQVAMSLWSSYHSRHATLGQMDTLRKATFLRAVKPVAEYYDGCKGLLRTEGRVEDFMDHYDQIPKPQKVLNVYGLVASLFSIALGLTAGVLQRDVSFGIQVLSVTLLAALPVTTFITVSRPTAILEKRLHRLGTVLCGWQGVESLSGRAVFALKHEDLFPAGSRKLNGVKFYGDRDPAQVMAYCAALVEADGGGLAPLFRHQLEVRNGESYALENLTTYPNGGIGGEVQGVPVLMGTGDFLRLMGVEVPEGILVDQAVFAAIDGELSGVFAVTYSRVRSSAAGLNTLSAYRKLRSVLTTGDFMLTEEFIRGCFRVNTRRLSFPERDTREELQQIQPEEETLAGALVTAEGLAPSAYAVTGARSLRSAARIGVTIHMIGGILGLAIMLTLVLLGARELLTPVNVLLYELAWLIPGLLVTEWTRSV